MFSNKRGRPGSGRSRYLAATTAMAVIVATLAFVGTGQASASGKTLDLGGTVTYADDGSPAARVAVDLYEAVTAWERGAWKGPALTRGDGVYDFAVEPDSCYIVVFIAPLGSTFGGVNSGRVYDQRYACVTDQSKLDLDNVLYREDTKPPPPPPTTQPPTTQPPTTQPPTTRPPTTQPPTTQPPTTRPPTTQPPTTQPPTTQPPNPPVTISSCVHWVKQGRVRLGNPTVDQSAINISIVTDTGEQLQLRWWVPRSGQSYHTSPVRGAEFLGLVGQNAAPIQWIEIDDGHGKPYRVSCAPKSPIGLDIDGSGSVERVAIEVQIDIDADGTQDTLNEWFAPTEGILVANLNGQEITGHQLFGDQGGLYADGFEKLSTLDTDRDGQVSGPELAGLSVWVDANSNALLDTGEVSTVADHGLVSLSTSHSAYLSSALLADGTVMLTEDVWFSVAPAGVASNTKGLWLLGAAGLALVGYAFAASQRRQHGLDSELAAITNQTETSTPEHL